MYRVIIADDEKSIRDGIKSSVNWEELGFEIIESFSDGYEVMDCLEYLVPDVILTDIKMNQISGMEIARFIHEQELPCKVVLISGYREFELAVEAVKYGVVDYLSKPLSVEKIRDTFQRIKGELDKKQYQLERAEKEKRYIEKMKSFLENEFLGELIRGVVSDKNVIKERMSLFFSEMNPQQVSCFVMNMEIENYEAYLEKNWEYSQEQLEENIRHYLQIYTDDVYRYYLTNKTRGLLELVGIGCAAGDELQLQAINTFQKEIEQIFGFKVSYKIRCFYQNIYDMSSNAVLTVEKEQEVSEQTKLLLSCVAMGNVTKAKKVLRIIIKVITDMTEDGKRKVLMRIIEDVSHLIRERDSSDSDSAQVANASLLLENMTIREMEKYCVRILDGISQDIKGGSYSKESVLENAKAYIENNIFSDMSREEVAQKVFVSPSYLSRIFVQETGEGFLQYVNRRKVEKSIEFLKNPNIKLYEISEKMGYKTPRYYSRLFQAQMGMTPKEYRIYTLSQQKKEVTK